MSNDKKKDIKIYTIHSQKGGVGKSSIALALAGLEGIIENKRVLLMDSDFTGTSFVDLPDWTSKNSKIRYSNEFLFCSPQDFITFKKQSFKDFLLPVPQEENIQYCSASPYWEDISLISDLISQEEYLGFFSFRLTDVLEKLFNKYDVIIFDNPPGLYGLSYSVYKLVMGLEERQEVTILKHSIFVTTGDSVDYKALLPSMNWLSQNIVNQHGNKDFDFFENADLILNKADKYLDPPRWMKIVTEELKGELFDGKRKLEDKFIASFKDKYTKTVLPRGRYAGDFKMENIIPTIHFLSSKYPTKTDFLGANLAIDQLTGEISKWCVDIGKAVWKK